MAMRYERLTTPLVQEGGELRDAPWDEAFDRAATGFRTALDKGALTGVFTRLRQSLVADASIMPTIPRANTNLTTIAIAERIAALIT